MSDPAGSKLLLQGRNVAARRGSQRLFSGLNFDVSGGTLAWLVGPNGSGKTTLLRIVAGLTQPEEGELFWSHAPLHKAERFHANLLYLGHSNGLKEDLTALEALLFLVRLHGVACTDAQAGRALQQMGIHHRRNLPVRSLSQGQRKRVALARLVLQSDSRLWVLDEPFDALDDDGIATVQALLQAHVGRGGVVMLTSHIPVTIPGIACVQMVLGAGANSAMAGAA